MIDQTIPKKRKYHHIRCKDQEILNLINLVILIIKRSILILIKVMREIIKLFKKVR